MPSEIVIYGDTRLFGVRIQFDADRDDVLREALDLFPQRDETGSHESSVYVVLRTYDVKEFVTDSSRVEGVRLSVVRDGIFIHADGERGRGACVFPGESVASEAVREAISTVVLFLVAQSGRTPVHASAIMLGELAVVMAGKSGAGKSLLALAGNRAGLPVLSEDTVFVQTAPTLRVWSIPRAIHVLEKDAPSAEGETRFRSSRWKHVLPIGTVRRSADRSILCLLARGQSVSLDTITKDEAVRALTQEPEPGYEFYGERLATAVRALAAEGVWRLTLADDPDAAISLLRATFAETVP